MSNERPINPHWLSLADGHLAGAFSVEDDYFVEDIDDTQGLYFDALVDELPESERDCVQLKVFAQLSYRQIAEELGWFTNGLPDKKKAWRNTYRGLRKLREKLSA